MHVRVKTEVLRDHIGLLNFARVHQRFLGLARLRLLALTMATENNNNNKLVLITGATGGIGRATAIAFAKAGGYDLALSYHKASQETRDEVLSAIKEAIGSSQTRTAFFQADMGNYNDIRKLHQEVTTDLGPVSILFNNAGANGGHSSVQSLADVPIDIFDQTWRINTGSAILLTQLCLPAMETANFGRIIFCSSVAAFTGGVVGPHYAASKASQHGFIHWLANNVAKKGITVNGVAPALIGDTNMMGRADDEEVVSRVAGRIPVGRLGRPEEVAATVLWMASVGYVTNKVVGVDGGYYPY